ncbi:conserved membrane hypothetical protein [Candidatus Terasakiella magnetica]|uniref:DUF2062 domain-containing protein n=1 Tax=Candidatus Terasakiella magnetica TaxID=1867952 RepID=A0A1C3RCU8_9PROT|nr:DUF2062 domain-containing protein [Candidatus Terasakiella magnetica]SCA55091.1 conserved membrane hypothetical protein [Candidatus Terasakiella magnetica]
MFRRRQQPKFHQKAIGFFWPAMGWKRSSKYVGHRVARLPGTPYSIAAGFAAGAAISFTPFMGLHIILGAAIAWLTRGNILASAIGTVVGNPWTFPFIWLATYKTGLMLGAGSGAAEEENLEFFVFFDKLIEAVKSLDWTYVGDVAWPVFWPMFIGGLPAFALSWALFFFPIRIMVKRYHSRRVKRHAIAKKSTFAGHPHDE